MKNRNKRRKRKREIRQYKNKKESVWLKMGNFLITDQNYSDKFLVTFIFINNDEFIY